MSPHPRNPLPMTALALVVLALVVLIENRHLSETDDQRRVERNRRRELEGQLQTRDQQLNGALEKITELKGGQPVSNGDDE